MMRGIVVIVALIANLLLIGTPVVLLGIVKFIVQMTAPRSRARSKVILLAAAVAEIWVANNNRIIDALLPKTRWLV